MQAFHKDVVDIALTGVERNWQVPRPLCNYFLPIIQTCTAVGERYECAVFRSSRASSRVS